MDVAGLEVGCGETNVLRSAGDTERHLDSSRTPCLKRYFFKKKKLKTIREPRVQRHYRLKRYFLKKCFQGMNTDVDVPDVWLLVPALLCSVISDQYHQSMGWGFSADGSGLSVHVLSMCSVGNSRRNAIFCRLTFAVSAPGWGWTLERLHQHTKRSRSGWPGPSFTRKGGPTIKL